MKKTYMPFLALLWALCASPSFAASNQPMGDEASSGRPPSPIVVHQLPAVVHESDTPIQQPLAQTNFTTQEDSQEQSLLLSMLADEILVHILSFVPHNTPSPDDGQAQPNKQDRLHNWSQTCRRGYRNAHEISRHIFIQNEKRFQEFCGFTFSPLSGEEKPLFPFAIETINGTPLPQILTQNHLPYRLWSLALSGKSSANLKQLQVVSLACDDGGINSLNKSPATCNQTQHILPQGLSLLVPTEISPNPQCILPLLSQLPKLKLLKVGPMPNARIHKDIDTTSLFGPSITEFSKVLGRLKELEVLEISHAEFIKIKNGEEAMAFAHAFRSMPNLRRLVLSSGSLGDEGMQLLAPALATTNLTELVLHQMNIGAAGGQALADHPHLLPRIKYLGLGDNNIGEDVIKRIAKIFAPTQGMTLLDFCACNEKTPEGKEIPTSPETKQYVKSLFKDYKNLFLVV